MREILCSSSIGRLKSDLAIFARALPTSNVRHVHKELSNAAFRSMVAQDLMADGHLPGAASLPSMRACGLGIQASCSEQCIGKTDTSEKLGGSSSRWDAKTSQVERSWSGPRCR